MRTALRSILPLAGLAFAAGLAAQQPPSTTPAPAALPTSEPTRVVDSLGAQLAPEIVPVVEVKPAPPPVVSDELGVTLYARERLDADFAAMRTFRPSYPFWRQIFSIPDGSVAYGSARDGRLLAVFPSRGGDWIQTGRWEDDTLARILEGVSLASAVTQRRDQVETLLASNAGPIVQNATRGNFLLPVRRYGSFLSEWGAIYERFGVPAEIGLSQAMIESGLDGRIRSEAKALGLCQWLPSNWKRLQRLASPRIIEGYNQTSQAPYCAAYLTILATKYGTFIPALSEHHTGGTNVGRIVINGAWLGGTSTRERYLLGSEFARDLREMAPGRYSELMQTYGPRSFLYAEMIFGNAPAVQSFIAKYPQQQVFAMRTARAIPLTEITQKTGLSSDEVKRFNPALVKQVPKGADLYLPRPMTAFGQDVSFWHRPADPAYSRVLNDFVHLSATENEWESPSFDSVLRDFQRRFEATRTEEGLIMADAISYTLAEMGSSRRILAEFRTSAKVSTLFQEGLTARQAYLAQRNGTGSK
jgi:hypothetical protein